MLQAVVLPPVVLLLQAGVLREAGLLCRSDLLREAGLWLWLLRKEVLLPSVGRPVEPPDGQQVLLLQARLRLHDLRLATCGETSGCGCGAVTGTTTTTVTPAVAPPPAPSTEQPLPKPPAPKADKGTDSRPQGDPSASLLRSRSVAID